MISNGDVAMWLVPSYGRNRLRGDVDVLSCRTCFRHGHLGVEPDSDDPALRPLARVAPGLDADVALETDQKIRLLGKQHVRLVRTVDEHRGHRDDVDGLVL